MEVVAGSRPERPHHLDDRHQSANLSDEQGSSPYPPPPPMPKGKQSFELRVLLQDAGRQLLYGPVEPQAKPPVFVELKVDDRTVGHLGLIPPRILSDRQI
jgi:hypothetical protein